MAAASVAQSPRYCRRVLLVEGRLSADKIRKQGHACLPFLAPTAEHLPLMIPLLNELLLAECTSDQASRRFAQSFDDRYGGNQKNNAATKKQVVC